MSGESTNFESILYDMQDWSREVTNLASDSKLISDDSTNTKNKLQQIEFKLIQAQNIAEQANELVEGLKRSQPSSETELELKAQAIAIVERITADTQSINNIYNTLTAQIGTKSIPSDRRRANVILPGQGNQPKHVTFQSTDTGAAPSDDSKKNKKKL